MSHDDSSDPERDVSDEGLSYDSREDQTGRIERVIRKVVEPDLKATRKSIEAHVKTDDARWNRVLGAAGVVSLMLGAIGSGTAWIVMQTFDNRQESAVTRANVETVRSELNKHDDRIRAVETRRE